MKLIKKLLLSMMIVIMTTMVSVTIVPELKSSYVVEAASVKISKKSVVLNVGQTYKLKVNGTKKKIKWSSSKKSVAKVDSKGKVTAKKNGTAIITAKVGNKKYTCKVQVKTPSLNRTSKTMYLNCTYKLKVNNTTQNIKWETSDKKIATVSKSGKVTAKKKGKATIIATIGKKKLKCTITVKNVLSVDKTAVSMKDNSSSKSINIKFRGKGTIYYKISNTDIVSCNWAEKWNGTEIKLYIEPLNIGTTDITITNTVNNEKIKIKVTVNPAIEIKMPTTPIVLKEYGYRNNVEQIYTVTNIKCEIEKNSYDGKYKATLWFEGDKSYDYRGAGQSDSAKIGWKLYKDGAVIESGTCYTSSLAEGERFIESERIYDLEEGVYELKLLSVN